MPRVVRIARACWRQRAKGYSGLQSGQCACAERVRLTSSPSKTPSRRAIFGTASRPEFPLIALFRFARPLLWAASPQSSAWLKLHNASTSESSGNRGDYRRTVGTYSALSFINSPDSQHCRRQIRR